MNIKEIIDTIEIAAAEVEWEYPLRYSIALTEGANLLSKQVELPPLITPIYISNKNNIKTISHYEYKCPICKEDLFAVEKYCTNCGQKIKIKESDK